MCGSVVILLGIGDGYIFGMYYIFGDDMLMCLVLWVYNSRIFLGVFVMCVS